MEYKYDIAISFAEEDRNAALALALAFELKGFSKVYYYPDKKNGDAGKKLEQELRNIYSVEARYIVILLSKKYFLKETAKIELHAILKRLSLSTTQVSVIPVKLKKGINLDSYPEIKALQNLDWDFQPKKIAEGLLEIFSNKKPPKSVEPIFHKDVTNGLSVSQRNKAKKVNKQSNNSTINL